MIQALLGQVTIIGEPEEVMHELAVMIAGVNGFLINSVGLSEEEAKEAITKSGQLAYTDVICMAEGEPCA